MGRPKHNMNSTHLYLKLIIDICYCRNTGTSAVGLRSLWDSERVSYDTKRGKWAFQKEPLLLKRGINDLISTARSLILIQQRARVMQPKKSGGLSIYLRIWGPSTVTRQVAQETKPTLPCIIWCHRWSYISQIIVPHTVSLCWVIAIGWSAMR